jgi:hypothetical protein
VDYEPVAGTKLYRFVVLAPKFKSLRHSERQDLVWRIAQRLLPFDEQILISMILTMTPQEAGVTPREMVPRRRKQPKKTASRTKAVTAGTR